MGGKTIDLVENIEMNNFEASHYKLNKREKA